MTLTGHVNWVLFIAYQYRASGYRAYCDASSGAVTFENQGGAILAHSANAPVTQSHHIDSNGNENFQCDATFAVRVPRQTAYRLSWTDEDMPRSNPGCDNSKSSADDERIGDSGRSTVAFPVISFTFLCT